VLDNRIQGVLEIRGAAWIRYNAIAGGDVGILFDGYDPAWLRLRPAHPVEQHRSRSVRRAPAGQRRHDRAAEQLVGRSATAEMTALGCDANIAAIHDGRDEAGLGIVDFCQWATAPLDLPSVPRRLGDGCIFPSS